MSPLRVAFVGDSLVRRTGVLDASDPARRFEVDLCSSFVEPLLMRALVSHPQVELDVANYGKSNATSDEVLQIVENDVRSFRPELTVILVGQVDPRHGDPARFAPNVSTMLHRLTKWGSAVLLLSTTPAPDRPELNPILQDLNRDLELAANECGVTFIDLWQPIARVEAANRQRRNSVRLFNSGCHFSLLGNVLIAELLFPAFETAITSARTIQTE